MKKIILTLVILLSLAGIAQAQSFDDFFTVDAMNTWIALPFTTGTGFSDITPLNPDLPGHGFSNDHPAPLGSEILILTALGAGYATAKRRKEVEK